MTINISGVANNNTFGGLVEKVNQLAEAFTANVVTADGSVGGATTQGNVRIDGKFNANVIAVNTIQGGTLTSSANLVIASNTSITMNSIDVMKVSYDTVAANIQYAIVANNMTLNSDKLQFAVANMMFDGANVHINSYLYVDNDMHANGTMFIKSMMTANGGANVHANLTVTGNTSITGKVAVTGNTDLTGSLAVSANAAITGNLTANWAGLTTANVTTLGANTLTVRLDASVGNNFVVGNNVTVANGSISVGNTTVNTVISSTTAYATTIRANNNLYVGNSTVNTAITPTVISAANVVVANTLTVGGNVVVTLNMQANTANAVVMTANTLSIANNSSFGGNILVTGNVSGGNVASFKTMAANALTANVFTVNTSVTVGNSTVNTAITTTQITVSNLVANNITVNSINAPIAINTTNDVNANNFIAVNSVTGNNLSATVNVSTAGITVTANAVIANAYITNANTRTSWTNTAVANSFTATTGNVVTFRANTVTANTITSAGSITATYVTANESIGGQAVSAITASFATIESLTPLGYKNYIDNPEFTITNRNGYKQFNTLTTLNQSYHYWPCDRWHIYVKDNTNTTGQPFTRGGVQGFTSSDTENIYSLTPPIVSWGGVQRVNGPTGTTRFTGKIYLDQMLPWDSVRALRNQYMALSFQIKKMSTYYGTATSVQVFSGNGTIPSEASSVGPDWAIDPLTATTVWVDAVKLVDKDLAAVSAGSWTGVGCPLFQVPEGATMLMVRFVFDYTGNANNDYNSADLTHGKCMITQVNLQPMDSRVTSINDWPPFERKPWAVEDYNCKRFYQSSAPLGYTWQGGETIGAEAVRLVAASTSAHFSIRLPVKMQHTPAVKWWSAGSSTSYNKIWNATSNSDITVTGTSTLEPTTTTRIGAPTFTSTGSANQLIMGHWEACAEGAANNSSYAW